MTGEIIDLCPRRQVPALPRTQAENEALSKMRNVVAMVDGGFMSVTEAWPWLSLELRRLEAEPDVAS